MKRDDYYPKRVAERPEWHANLAAKLPIYATVLGLTTAEVDAAVADNLTLAYGLGEWITNVREFGPACTAALTTLTSGTGNDFFVFTPYTLPPPPTLPSGLTGITPGALDRTFGLVRQIKGKVGYTEDIGLDLGIVGSEMPAPPSGDAPPPRLTLAVLSGDANQRGCVKFFKDGHEYVIIESRRGTGGWEQLAMTNKSPSIDDRPLQVAGQAEVREYRARFFDDGTTTSDWCDVGKLTVGP